MISRLKEREPTNNALRTGMIQWCAVEHPELGWLAKNNQRTLVLEVAGLDLG